MVDKIELTEQFGRCRDKGYKYKTKIHRTEITDYSVEMRWPPRGDIDSAFTGTDGLIAFREEPRFYKRWALKLLLWVLGDKALLIIPSLPKAGIDWEKYRNELYDAWSGYETQPKRKPIVMQLKIPVDEK